MQEFEFLFNLAMLHRMLIWDDKKMNLQNFNSKKVNIVTQQRHLFV